MPRCRSCLSWTRRRSCCPPAPSRSSAACSASSVACTGAGSCPLRLSAALGSWLLMGCPVLLVAQRRETGLQTHAFTAGVKLCAAQLDPAASSQPHQLKSDQLGNWRLLQLRASAGQPAIIIGGNSLAVSSSCAELQLVIAACHAATFSTSQHSPRHVVAACMQDAVYLHLATDVPCLSLCKFIHRVALMEAVMQGCAVRPRALDDDRSEHRDCKLGQGQLHHSGGDGASHCSSRAAGPTGA